MTKVILSGYIRVADDDLEAVKSELPNHVRQTLNEPGCVTFRVTPTTDPNRFDVYEEFESRQAFDHHQDRVQASHWGKVTSRVERFYAINDPSSDQGESKDVAP